ncbi:SDR family oxidoreductase [Streptomyces sp. NPDC003233]
MSRRLAAEDAAGLLLADLDVAAVEDLASELDEGECRVVGMGSDTTRESDVRTLVATAEQHFGPIDLFCSAASLRTGQGTNASNALWQASWEVNVMVDVYAARAVLPAMVARGRGHLLSVASAAGLSTTPQDAPHSVTTHAAVTFARWLAAAYGARGIGISMVGPLTLPGSMGPGADEVAQAVACALKDDRFPTMPTTARHPAAGHRQ